jgi:regulator of replication initiation timing
LVIPLDKKDVNEVVDSLKKETASIVEPQIKKVFTGLFNLIEELASENEKLTIENQQLKNEVNELKGEQGKPDVKPNIKIDREHKCEIDKSTLPPDAINKGFTDIVIQDIQIITDNVRYRRETYYSPASGKTFIAPLPEGVAGKGEFGVGVRSLIPLFKSECHLPESAILTFFSNFGIHTSAAYISKQWTDGYDHFNQEKEDIVTAGIASCTY